VSAGAVGGGEVQGCAYAAADGEAAHGHAGNDGGCPHVDRRTAAARQHDVVWNRCYRTPEPRLKLVMVWVEFAPPVAPLNPKKAVGPPARVAKSAGSAVVLVTYYRSPCQ